MRVIATIAAFGALVSIGCGPGLDTPESSATTTTDASEGEATDDGASPNPSTTFASTGEGPSADTTADEGWGTAYEGDGGSDDGCSFTCPPPPGPPNNGGECSYWRQDCPEGEKCMPWANDGGLFWNSTRCAPLAPEPGAPGDPCQVEGSFVSGIDDCELGAICLPDDFAPQDGQGTCAPLCQGACPQPGDVCIELPLGIPHCTHPCDPLELDACGGGRVCANLVPQDGSSAFVCQPTLLEPPFTSPMSCYTSTSCLPGQFCASPRQVAGCHGRVGCCADLCDLQDPEPTCPSGSGGTCTSIEAVPGTMWEDLGLCVLPG